MSTQNRRTINREFAPDQAALGTVSGDGVTVEEFGTGALRTTRITFSSTPITITDEAGVVGHGGLKVYDFPLGHLLFLGAVADLSVVSSGGVTATFDGDFGVGTAIAGNNNALATTEQNLIPTTAIPQAVSNSTTANGASTTSESGVVFDGSSTAIDAYLNALVDDADQAGGTLTVSGTLQFNWVLLGQES